MDEDEVPPLQDLLNAPIHPLHEHQVSERILSRCSSLDLYQIVFTNHVYVLCVDKTDSAKARYLFGKEFQVEFSPAKNTTIVTPKLKCTKSMNNFRRPHLRTGS